MNPSKAMEVAAAAAIAWLVYTILEAALESPDRSAGPWSAVGRNFEAVLRFDRRTQSLEGDVSDVLDRLVEVEERTAVHKGWIGSLADRIGTGVDELEEELESLEGMRPEPSESEVERARR